MELLKVHAFSLKESTNLPNYQKTMNTLDSILHLPETFGMQLSEAHSLLVLFVFSVVWQLVDVALDDEGIQLKDCDARWPIKPQVMEIDIYDPYDDKRKEFRDRLHTMNTVMALELIARFLKNKVTSRILYLARQNMYSHWTSFIHGIHLLIENSSALRNSKSITVDVL